MVKKETASVEQFHTELSDRLKKTATSTRKIRREIVKVDFGEVAPDLFLTRCPSEELLVILAEKIHQTKTVISEQVAKKLLIKATQTADALEDTAGGNDGYAKFLSESEAYLEKVNPGMLSDMRRIMEAATTRGETRAQRRDAFYRKWRAAQTR